MRQDLTEGRSEYRELIKEQDQLIYDFCHLMLGPSPFLDDLVLSIFRSFGERYRKLSHKGVSEPLEWRVLLYRLAWQEIEAADRSWTRLEPIGRDTRSHKELDEDLAKEWEKNHRLDPDRRRALERRIVEIELEHRAPLVLRDILGIEDDQVMRILDLRWGVYRHRLHRGRMELATLLRGAVA